MRRLAGAFRQLRRYPSAVAGLTIVSGLLVLNIITVIAIPYPRALELWRGGEPWEMHPAYARPSWVNAFRRVNLPRTRIVSSRDAEVRSETLPSGRRMVIPLAFDYTDGAFPSEINLFLNARFETREPFLQLTWHTPDGRTVPLGGRTAARTDRVSISQDRALAGRLGLEPHEGLLARPGAPDDPEVLPGRYELRVEALLFEAEADLEATLVIYGQVHGWAGTDHQRRDLGVALLWGGPVAMAFGLLAAVGTTLTTLFIGAAGVWFGGWIDALIQRVTEVNMILPALPIMIMIGTLYSQSIWVMLAVIVVLGIFSAGIKMYRAMLLPIREAPYIEAARAYGAGNLRIILRYMIPRILPVLIPGFVSLIPSFVFLEASLAVLGLGDPVLPTWGKILHDAQSQSALYHGHYYWVVQPAALLMLTGLGFAMLGFALDRVFNPRLRDL